MYLSFLKMSYIPPLLGKTFYLRVHAVCHPVYECVSQKQSLRTVASPDHQPVKLLSSFPPHVTSRGSSAERDRSGCDICCHLHFIHCPLIQTHTQTDIEGVLLHFLTTLQPPAMNLNLFLGAMQP